MSIDSVVSSNKLMRECLRDRLEVVGGENSTPSAFLHRLVLEINRVEKNDKGTYPKQISQFSDIVVV